MINLLDFEPWWRFGVALLIGAMLGMEREFFQQKEGAPDFAGIRTFSLIALLGSVTAFLVKDFGMLPIAVSLGGVDLINYDELPGSHVTEREGDWNYYRGGCFVDILIRGTCDGGPGKDCHSIGGCYLAIACPEG